MKLDDDDLLTENLRKLACELRVGRKLRINFYDSIYVASIPPPTSLLFYRRLKIGTNRLRVYRFPDFRYAYDMDNESYRFVGLQPSSHSCPSNRSFCVVSEKYAGRSHARRLALTRTLSATTFESTASMPPPSAAVMNSCVLYASSGHFFRRGNGGSKVGPETNKRGCLRSFIWYLSSFVYTKGTLRASRSRPLLLRTSGKKPFGSRHDSNVRSFRNRFRSFSLLLVVISHG